MCHPWHKVVDVSGVEPRELNTKRRETERLLLPVVQPIDHRTR